jgi:hypothetical protein
MWMYMSRGWVMFMYILQKFFKNLYIKKLKFFKSIFMSRGGVIYLCILRGRAMCIYISRGWVIYMSRG